MTPVEPDDLRDDDGVLFVELQRCDNCHYSRCHGTVMIFCHRYAPRPKVGYDRITDDWAWVPVDPTEWCGEWKEDKSL